MGGGGTSSPEALLGWAPPGTPVRLIGPDTKHILDRCQSAAQWSLGRQVS